MTRPGICQFLYILYETESISCEPDAQSLFEVLENDHEVMKNMSCTSRGGSLGMWESLSEEGEL